MNISRTLGILIAIVAYLASASFASAQDTPAPNSGVAGGVSQPQSSQENSAAPAPLRLTLQDALKRARENSPQFHAALTSAGIAHEDRKQALDALLPSVNYNNSAIYTQAASPVAQAATQVPVVFIANNAVHEYVSQANIHEALDAAGVFGFRRASAAAALASAQSEIAARGLVVTVVQNYYSVAAAQQKLEAARKNSDEGERFFKLTQQLDQGGEVAHSDVIKAELQMQDRLRQFREAQLALLNARLDLAVLIFPDFNDRFEIADDLHAPAPLPTLDEVRQQAAKNNPDVRAALAALREAGSDVLSARSGYLPSLDFDYFYGIDATRFAVNSVFDGQKFSNLGSAATVTLNIPVWNWGATQSRVKQAQLRRSQAQRELSLTQRKLLAEMQSLHAEASTAFEALEGLHRSADLAAESLRLITLRYKDGESTVLEVVDAQTTLAQADTAYQDGAVRYRVALANLQTLTGVLTIP